MNNPDNIFDKDDTLDYLIYKECEKEACNRQGNKKGRSGCLGLLLLLAIPVGLLVPFCLQLALQVVADRDIVVVIES
jgi:hypothetical protein